MVQALVPLPSVPERPEKSLPKPENPQPFRVGRHVFHRTKAPGRSSAQRRHVTGNELQPLLAESDAAEFNPPEAPPLALLDGRSTGTQPGKKLRADPTSG